MNKKAVFAVERSLPVTENTWLVRGRTYHDLKIGDTVAVIDGSTAASQFIITAISTYGKEVQKLNRMLTGDLILRGANGDGLKEAGMLVKSLDASSD